MLTYRQIGTRAPGYEPMTFYSSDAEGGADSETVPAEVDPAERLARLSPASPE